MASEKHGKAVEEHILDERKELRDKTHEQLRRWRDSIDIEDNDVNVTINMSPVERFRQSIRPSLRSPAAKRTGLIAALVTILTVLAEVARHFLTQP